MIHIRLLLCILLSYCTTIKTMDEALAPFACTDDSYLDPLPKLWEDGFLPDIQHPLDVTTQESDTVTLMDDETDSVRISREIVIRPENTRKQLQSPDFYKKLTALRERFGRYDKKGKLHYLCQYAACTVAATSMHILKNHEQKQHKKDKPYQCDYPSCKCTYPHLLNLYMHAQQHFSAFSCPYSCNMSFGQSTGLLKHIKAHHSEPQQFVCQHCKAFFARRHIDFNTHINKCSENPNNMTDHSNQTAKQQFLSPSSMPVLANMILSKKRKLMSEPTDNAHNDEENNKAIFTALENRFKIRKEGTYRYPCQYPRCNVIKISMKQMDMHTRTKHENDSHKPYHCDYPDCTYQCKYFRTLRGHVIQHLKLNYCEPCDIAYSCPARLKRHVSTKHPRKR